MELQTEQDFYTYLNVAQSIIPVQRIRDDALTDDHRKETTTTKNHSEDFE